MLTVDFMKTFPRFFQMIANEIQTNADVCFCMSRAQRFHDRHPDGHPKRHDRIHRFNIGHGKIQETAGSHQGIDRRILVFSE